MYVCPWSNTVSAEGLAGSVLNGVGSFARNCLLGVCQKKSATVANYLTFVSASFPKLNLGRILAVLSFSGVKFNKDTSIFQANRSHKEVKE